VIARDRVIFVFSRFVATANDLVLFLLYVKQVARHRICISDHPITGSPDS